jgi:hypothetical protein
MVTLVDENGWMTSIDNSGHAVYGYDQRVKVFGSDGIAASESPLAHSGVVRRAAGGRGSVVNIIVMASRGGEPVLMAYTASKGALVNGLNIGSTATEGEHGLRPGDIAPMVTYLLSHAAALIWRALERGRTGILHCGGGERAHRDGLARAAVETFGVDDPLAFGPPDPGATGDEPNPYDTRLDASATVAALGVTLPDLRSRLARLCERIDTERVEEDTITA